MLKVIKEERKKLTEYLYLFTEKIDDVKKKTEKWNVFVNSIFDLFLTKSKEI